MGGMYFLTMRLPHDETSLTEINPLDPPLYDSANLNLKSQISNEQKQFLSFHRRYVNVKNSTKKGYT